MRQTIRHDRRLRIRVIPSGLLACRRASISGRALEWVALRSDEPRDFSDANVRIRGGRLIRTGHSPTQRNDDARSGNDWIVDRSP